VLAVERYLPRGELGLEYDECVRQGVSRCGRTVCGQTIVLADFGFRDNEGVPETMKICQKGTWNERMCVETVLAMLTMVCDLKRIRHRVTPYIQARLAYVAAMFNSLLTLFHQLHPDADPFQMSIAEFSL
jgi:hypothetical protein